MHPSKGMEQVTVRSISVRYERSDYFTELIKNVKYWHIYREIETVRNSELLEEIDDDPFFDYTEYCDDYYIEPVGFE